MSKTEQTNKWKELIGHDCEVCRWEEDGACTIPCCDYEPKIIYDEWEERKYRANMMLAHCKHCKEFVEGSVTEENNRIVLYTKCTGQKDICGWYDRRI